MSQKWENELISRASEEASILASFDSVALEWQKNERWGALIQNIRNIFGDEALSISKSLIISNFWTRWRLQILR